MRPWAVLLPLLATVVAATSFDSSSSYRPTHLSSVIELGGSLTRSTATYQLEPSSSESNTGGDEWIVGVRHGGKNGGWVEATQGRGGKKQKVQLNPVFTKEHLRWIDPSGACSDQPQCSSAPVYTNGQDLDLVFYSLAITPPPTGTKATVTISTVLSHASVPKPATLPQNAESIYMFWEGDLLAPLAGLSPQQRINLEEVKVKIKTPTPRVLSAREPEGFAVQHSQGSSMVTFTSKGNVASLPASIAAIHYQQPEAVAAIRNLDRIVEISHWGSNLAIQDNIDLTNAGPALEGHFARIDHQKATMMRRQNNLAITSLAITLPPHAHAAYYYDAVGNVSTSRFRPSTDSSSSQSAVLPSQKKRQSTGTVTPALLELQPRYPLLGGWNFSFTIGYDLPLADFLKVRKAMEGSKAKYVAAVPFLTPIKDVAIDRVRLEIRLPEGARNIRAIAPFPVEEQPLKTVKTYLDSVGRPTIVMEKTGCTDRHGENVFIEYDLPLVVDLFQKPLAVASVLSTIFFAIVIAKRTSWGISAK